jgi:hypothetical protein
MMRYVRAVMPLVVWIVTSSCDADVGQLAPDGPVPAADRGGDRLAPDDADGAGPRDGRPEDSAAAKDGTAVTPCGEFASATTRSVCAKDGNSRGKCVNGSLAGESCARGCLRNKAPADDVCIGTTTTWSCTGVQGTVKAQDGDYYITSFGCWIDSSGVAHGDPGDNCSPGCLSAAKTAGLCQSSGTGKQCEEKVNYFTANNGRFPCLQRLRISNPKNGKQVIAVVLDGGPACWVEQKVSKAILDASTPVSMHLFGTAHGWSDKALVHVVEVDNSTPLGPLP